MLNRDFFKKINFNRCEILLSEAESYFLYSKFKKLIVLNESKNIFSKENISKILIEFCKTSSKRYFSESDVKYLSKYYESMIKEEIGRGRENQTKKVDPNRVIEFMTGLNAEQGVNHVEGNDNIVFLKGEEPVKEVDVDSPDEAHVYLKNVESKAMSKQ